MEDKENQSCMRKIMRILVKYLPLAKKPQQQVSVYFFLLVTEMLLSEYFLKSDHKEPSSLFQVVVDEVQGQGGPPDKVADLVNTIQQATQAGRHFVLFISCLLYLLIANTALY